MIKNLPNLYGMVGKSMKMCQAQPIVLTHFVYPLYKGSHMNSFEKGSNKIKTSKKIPIKLLKDVLIIIFFILTLNYPRKLNGEPIQMAF